MSRRALAGGLAPALSAGWNAANIGSVALVLSHAYGVSLIVIGLFTTALFVSHAALRYRRGGSVAASVHAGSAQQGSR